MKKLIIAAVISIFFEVPSYGQSGVTVDLSVVNLNELLPDLETNSETALMKKHIDRTERILDAITGHRTISKDPKKDDGGLFLINPQFIYDNKKQADIVSTIPEQFKKILRDENYLRNSSVHDARETIDERLQYAAVIDKVIALQIFQEIENRFEQIANMLVTLDQMKDLKGVAELQVRMKGMLAMIQNEMTKLQMVKHSRNIEQTLISRLQRKRNVQILGSKNTEMPKIR
ncbi:type IV secretion system protein [Bartonella jaculi]|uniref:P-type DNA transfer protein VirB5 n=1 Tax=Bartonella jaculi TaxID=686226 RepID=A0ABP9NBP0_9HYPH